MDEACKFIDTSAHYVDNHAFNALPRIVDLPPQGYDVDKGRHSDG